MFKRISLAVALVALIFGVSYATTLTETGRIVAQSQKAKGGLQTSSTAATISSQGETITGVDIRAGVNPLYVGLYDTPDVASKANANCVFQGGAAANTTYYVNLANEPINTTTGLVIAPSDSNGGTVVYTLQASNR